MSGAMGDGGTRRDGAEGDGLEATLADPAGRRPRDVPRATLAGDAGSTGSSAADTIAGRLDPVAAEPAATLGVEVEGQGEAPGRGRALPAIPGYLILGELGRGAMGVVYLGRELRLNRPCAIKMILAGAHADPVTAARFLAEAEAVARLRHPSVAQIHHIGEADGLPFLELEYLDGGSLDRQLGGKPLPARQAAELVESLARGVTEAHRLGLIHRDLKPANILLDADGRPKIADFGLAKSLDLGSALTRTDSVLGSPSYMAPEQAEGKARAVGPRSDIYALGAILYELLAGRPPFRGESVLETLEQVKNVEPVPPSRLQPKLPRDAETIALKCLEKDPARRYGSARELAEDLQRFLDGEPIRARPVSLPERTVKWARRRPALAALIVAVNALVAALLALGAWSYGTIRNSLASAQEERARAVSSSRQETEARRRAELARADSEAARNAAWDEAYRATLSEVRALRLAHAPGWRDTALGNLARLAAAPTPRGDPRALRTQAVACLMELDLREVARYHGSLGHVRSIDFGPDGQTLAAADYFGRVHVWDLEHDRRLVEVVDPDADPSRQYGRAGQSPMPAVRIQPGGSRLAYTTWSRGVAWLDLPAASTATATATSGPSATIDPPRLAGSLAFDRPGRRLAVGWKDDQAGVYDAETGGLIREFPIRSWIHTPVALSPDGRWLAAVGPKFSVQLHKVAEPGAAITLGSHRSNIRTLAFSPDGQLLASGSDDQTSKLWDVREADEFSTLRGHRAALNALAFSPDGRWLATASDDRSVRLWDTRSGQALMVVQPNLSALLAVAFSPDGTRLAIASDLGTISVFQLQGQHERRRLVGHHSEVYGVVFAPGRPALASADGRREVIEWDLTTGRPRRRWNGHPDLYGRRLAYSPDGSTLVLGPGEYQTSHSTDFGLRVWDIRPERPELRRVLRGPETSIHALAIDEDGRRVAAGCKDGRVFVWDAATGKVLAEEFLPGGVVIAVTFFRRGSSLSLAAGTHGGTLVLRDLDGGTLRRRVALDPGVEYFARRGDRLIAGGHDGTLRLIALPELDVLTVRPQAQATAIRAVAWSPAGSLIATGATDGRILLHDSVGLEPIAELPGLIGPVTELAFDPSGRWLAVCGVEMDVTLFDLAQVGVELGRLRLNWGPAERSPTAADRSGAEESAVRVVDSGLDLESLARARELLQSGQDLGGRARSDDAIARLIEARALLQTLARAHPDQTAVLRQLALTELSLGDIQEAAGQPREAAESFARSQDSYERLAHPSVVDLYNLGCAHARLGSLAGRGIRPAGLSAEFHADRALEALRRAIRAGYRDAEHLRRDPDLQAVRSRAEFAVLLQDVGFPEDPFARGDEPLEATIWQKIGGGWIARHDQPPSAIAAQIEANRRRGLRPTYLSAYPGPSWEPLYSAFWRDDTRPFRVQVGVDRATFDRACRELPEGYEPAWIGVHDDGVAAQWTGIWVKPSESRPWTQRLDLDRAGLEAALSERQAEGERPTLISAYPGPGGAARFAAVWVRDRTPTRVHIRLSRPELEQLRDSLPKNHRPSWVHGYSEGGRSFYTLIVEESPDLSEWRLTLETPSNQIQDLFDAMSREHLAPVLKSRGPVRPVRD